MITYICTCGTSIITNRNINTERIDNLPLSKAEEVKEDIEIIKDQVLERLDAISDFNEISAEIKSLLKMGIKPEDKAILISTDTIDGNLSAELIKEFLISKRISNVQIKVINGLQACDGKLFSSQGIKELISYLISFEHENVILNITGGYKGVVPYVALIGMLFNKPIHYIYEDSDDLITLSHIPILINEDIILKVENKLRKIEKETCISKDEWQDGIDYNDHRFDCLVEEEKGYVTLSGIGLLFWERFKRDYPDDLLRDLTPPYEKVNGLKRQKKQGSSHHGIDRLIPLSEKVLQSPFVKSVLRSCRYQPHSKRWVNALSKEKAEEFIQLPLESICVVTDINSDAGYSFLIETTARNLEENKRIAELLERKFFK